MILSPCACKFMSEGFAESSWDDKLEELVSNVLLICFVKKLFGFKTKINWLRIVFSLHLKLSCSREAFEELLSCLCNFNLRAHFCISAWNYSLIDSITILLEPAALAVLSSKT